MQSRILNARYLSANPSPNAQPNERKFSSKFSFSGQRAAISTASRFLLSLRFRCRSVSAAQWFPLVVGHNTGPLLLVPCHGTTHRPSAAGALHAPKPKLPAVRAWSKTIHHFLDQKHHHKGIYHEKRRKKKTFPPHFISFHFVTVVGLPTSTTCRRLSAYACVTIV